MHSYKISDSLNNFLVAVQFIMCVVSALRIRNGGGAGWFVILGASGYFIIAGVYQRFFKRSGTLDRGSHCYCY
jgi:hypothetical protein